MTARAGFEADLLDCWTRRDFPAWLECRSIFADWLEERNDPLCPMARAVCTMSPCTVRTKGRPRPWLWRLYFRLPMPLIVGAAPSRWARNRRMNGAPLLGFPRATLRCMEVEEDQARFTLTFKERKARKWVRHYRGTLANAGEWVDAAFDTDLHPAGFARLFWPARYPAEWEPASVVADPEPTLFDNLEAPCPTHRKS